MPANSNSLLVAAMATSVDKIFDSAVIIWASATLSGVGLAMARSMADPPFLTKNGAISWLATQSAPQCDRRSFDRAGLLNAIGGSGMIVTQTSATLAVQFLPQCAFLIFFLHEPATL